MRYDRATIRNYVEQSRTGLQSPYIMERLQDINLTDEATASRIPEVTSRYKAGLPQTASCCHLAPRVRAFLSQEPDLELRQLLLSQQQMQAKWRTCCPLKRFQAGSLSIPRAFSAHTSSLILPCPPSRPHIKTFSLRFLPVQTI